MPRPEVEPVGYLTKRGRRIFQLIVSHCKDSGFDLDIDVLELTMLANSFDLYEDAASRLNKLRGENVPDVFGKGGKVSSDYIVMKSEYEKVMKHGPKYGLNPGDRHKIFGGLKKKEKKNPNEGLD
jgi:hypothetical protein